MVNKSRPVQKRRTSRRKIVKDEVVPLQEVDIDETHKSEEEDADVKSSVEKASSSV